MGDNSPDQDYGELSALQGLQNQQVVDAQTTANRSDMFTPFGYSKWTSENVLDPNDPSNTFQKWSNTTGLTPELQDILNKQTAITGARSDVAGNLVGRMGDEFGRKMDWSNFNPMAATPNGQYTMPESYEGIAQVGDPARMRQRAEEAYMGKANSRLDPAYAQKRQGLEAQMRNQGLSPEDAAWKSRMGGLGQQETDAYGQAQYDAIRAGLGEQSQLFGQDMGMRQQAVGEANNQFGQALSSNAQNFGQNMDSANYSNQIRQQQIAEAQQERGQSLNEINALQSGGQVGMPTMPSFQQAGAATPTPIYQGGVDQGNFDAASSPWAGIANIAGQLGGAAIGKYG